MPEGLNPIEAGKKLHEHGETGQEEAEKKKAVTVSLLTVIPGSCRSARQRC
jgi:hypothetical protein